MTFSVLVFATKCVKERVILGAETCDISHSRETTGSESDTGIWDFVTASFTYSQQFHVEMLPPIGTGVRSPDRNRVPGSGTLSQLLSPTVGSFTCRNESTDQDWDQISAGPLGFRSQDLEHFFWEQISWRHNLLKKVCFWQKIR